MKYLIVVFIAVFFTSQDTLASDKMAKNDHSEGKKIAFNRKKGNCLTCHQIDDGKLSGNAGPALIAMKSRFPDKAVLRAQIWDASVKNRYTVMPPFGRHAILSESEIDKVVDYIYSL